MVGKTVLITGSTRGIGLALAQHYIKLGWNVIGAARDINNAEKLKNLSPYKIVQLDTSDETSIVNAAEELKDEAIDLLINNAGIAIHADLAGTTKEDLFHHFEVNSVGPFLTTRAFIPHLKRAVAKNGSSLVAQISSTAGSLGSNVESYGYYAYRTSKSALNTLSLCLAHDLKGDSIGMVILCPGYVITDMNTHSGVITPDESASGLISVIDKVTLADTGKFISYAGESVPW